MKITDLFAPVSQPAEDYLKHRYDIPRSLPALPLEDEAFAAAWRKAEGQGVLDFLAAQWNLSVSDFSWENIGALQIFFAKSLGGRLPAIATKSHADFRAMEALLNGRKKTQMFPSTVNAFTMQAKAEPIFRHRVLLLNDAPYSHIPAETMGLPEEDWLARSHRLRLRHECAHYETLRLFGGMKNHALDEIVADALGQIAAFGNFDADRQRIFFGLEKGKGTCTGRLSFYCRDVAEAERPQVYRAVDQVLDAVAAALAGLLARNAADAELLTALAGTSIWDWREAAEKHGTFET